MEPPVDAKDPQENFLATPLRGLRALKNRCWNELSNGYNKSVKYGLFVPCITRWTGVKYYNKLFSRAFCMILAINRFMSKSSD